MMRGLPHQNVEEPAEDPPLPVSKLDDEHQRIETHRAQELVKGGFPAGPALAIAKDRSIDYHRAINILKGCGDVELALSIIL